MPLYACAECNTVENTALGGYWQQQLTAQRRGVDHRPLCSACDPEIGEWHGQFERVSADGYVPSKRMPTFIRLPHENI